MAAGGAITVGGARLATSGYIFSHITHVRRSVSLGRRNRGIYNSVMPYLTWEILRNKLVSDKVHREDNIPATTSPQSTWTLDQTVHDDPLDIKIDVDRRKVRSV